MRYLMVPSLFVLSLFLIAASGDAKAGVIARAEISDAGPTSVQFVRETRRSDETRKSDTVTGRLKRAWKDLVGYKFAVSCPLAHTTCTETGASRGDARAKCISQNPLCWVADAD
jgi:hypothetical protein